MPKTSDLIADVVNYEVCCISQPMKKLFSQSTCCSILFMFYVCFLLLPCSFLVNKGEYIYLLLTERKTDVKTIFVSTATFVTTVTKKRI